MSDKEEKLTSSSSDNTLNENFGTYTTLTGNLDIIDNQSTEISLQSDVNVEEITHTETNKMMPEEEIREKALASDNETDAFHETGYCVKNEEAISESKGRISIPCEPCLESKNEVESIMYCIDCEEYLCKGCVEMHRGVKLTKTHNLVSRNMSDEHVQVVRINKKEECPIHMNEYIEWFCKSDEKLCCHICKIIQHRNCKCVDIIENMVDTGKTQAVLQLVTETQAKLKNAIDQKKTLVEYIEEDRSDSLRVLEKIINDTENKFESLKNILERESRKIESKYCIQKEHIKTDIENCSKIIDNLDATTTLLQKENICMEYKFIQMKKAEEQLKAVKKTVSNFPSAPLGTPIGYERDKLLDQKLGAFGRFGYFDDEKRLYNVSEHEKIKITQEYENETNVFAICAQEDECILIADWTNRAVKLVNINKGVVMSKLKLPGSPFGVCKLEQNDTFAVTITHKQRVTFVRRVGEDVTTDGKVSFQTGEKCRGISYCNDKLFVACGGRTSDNEGPGHIRVFDMNGKFLQTVLADAYGSVIVSVPYHIELLPGGTNALLTDCQNLIQCDLSNNTIQKVTDIPICPYYASVAFDLYKRVIISEPMSKSIKLFSSDRQRVESIVTDLPTEPLAIAISNSDLTLLVGLEKSDYLLCFQMEKIHWDKPPNV